MSKWLFQNWANDADAFPPPYNAAELARRRTDIKSKYNATKKPVSTLHASMLKAILAAIQLRLDSSGSSKGAIGQSENYCFAEYCSDKDERKETCLECFNINNGVFRSGKVTEQRAAEIAKSDSVTAKFMALIPLAFLSHEFKIPFDELELAVKNGDDLLSENNLRYAFVLCDNLYRRIVYPSECGEKGILIADEREKLLTEDVEQQIYVPDEVWAGTFRYFCDTSTEETGNGITHTDFVGKYKLSHRKLTAREKKLIPELPAWYVIPPVIRLLCEHSKGSTDSNHAMRNFMLRGDAGSGKTEGARAFSAGIWHPHLQMTCSANFESYDFLGKYLPDTSSHEVAQLMDKYQFPELQEITLDPATAYEKLTGKYCEDVSPNQVYKETMERLKQVTIAECGTSGKNFKFVDSPLVISMREGYTVEIAEPSVISDPGVLVGLNSLLDRSGRVELYNGETLIRHPDAVVIITTNIDYAGTRPINQSVLSRMDLIVDVNLPTPQVLAERVCNITGCTDQGLVRDMAECVYQTAKFCRERTITDGDCGVRQLINWVQSYMITSDIHLAAQYTLLSSVSSDPENQAEVRTACLEPRFGKPKRKKSSLVSGKAA